MEPVRISVVMEPGFRIYVVVEPVRISVVMEPGFRISVTSGESFR